MSELRNLRVEDAEQVAALFVEAFGEARRLDAEEIRTWLDNKELEAGAPARARRGRRASSATATSGSSDDEVALDVAAPGRWDDVASTGPRRRRARARRRGPRAVLPGRARARADRRAARLPARALLVHDGDRARRAPQPTCPPAARAPLLPRRGPRSCARRAERGVPRTTGTTTTCRRRTFSEFYLEQRGFDPSLWLLAWDGDELAGFVLATARARRRPRRSAGSERSASAAAWRRRGLGEALLRASFARAVRTRPPRVGLGVDARERRPARCGSTSASACAPMRALRQLGARAVSALRARCPDCRTLTAVAIGAGVPVPLLRARVRRRARARAARVGRRRRGDGRGGEHGAAVARGGRRRGGDARRADRARSARELPARPLVLGGCCCAHVGAVRELARRHGRLARRLDRRARRPEHARVVAVRQRLGDAAADADRRRRRRRRRT